jgi:hypothetical protein
MRRIMNGTCELADASSERNLYGLSNPCRRRGPSRLRCSRASNQPAILKPTGRNEALEQNDAA